MLNIKKKEIISNEMIHKLVKLNKDFLDKRQLLKQNQNIEMLTQLENSN